MLQYKDNMTESDKPKNRVGIALDGRSSDQDYYAGPEAAYDTTIDVDDSDNRLYDEREKAIAR